MMMHGLTNFKSNRIHSVRSRNTVDSSVPTTRTSNIVMMLQTHNMNN